MHIAQLNIGRIRYPLDDPRMAGFVNALAAINGIADRSPGFVWRMKDEGGQGNTGTQYTADPLELCNMSVWESVDALEHFVWNTAHKHVYAQKHAWFEIPAKPTVVIWPINEGHIPTIEEALARLEHLRAHGSTDHAFYWDHMPHLKAWFTKQCA